MPKHKIEAMYTSFYANKARDHCFISPWTGYANALILSHTPYQGFSKYVPPSFRSQNQYQNSYQAHYPTQHLKTDRVQNTNAPIIQPSETKVPDCPALSSTTSKENKAAPALTSAPKQPYKPHLYQPTPKDLPPKSESRNPWINGTRKWSAENNGQLCVRCGHLGHISQDCIDKPLPAWEQSYLKEIVFRQSAQSNFIMAGFGGFDGPEIRPYGSPSASSQLLTLTSSEDPGSLKMSDAISSASANSIRYSFAGLSTDDLGPQSNVVEAKYGERSGPNKRPHRDDSQIISQQTV